MKFQKGDFVRFTCPDKTDGGAPYGHHNDIYEVQYLTNNKVAVLKSRFFNTWACYIEYLEHVDNSAMYVPEDWS